MKFINSTVLNKFQLYSRISALGPEGHCTKSFKRAMCRPISCRPHVDVHAWGGSLVHVDACGQREGIKNLIFCGRHKRMAVMVANTHLKCQC